jgi:hypothetical protein
MRDVSALATRSKTFLHEKASTRPIRHRPPNLRSIIEAAFSLPISNLLDRAERSSPQSRARRAKGAGLDGENADRAIIEVPANADRISHCPRDRVPNFTLYTEIQVVSDPEFLREGAAIRFKHSDHIVIGSDLRLWHASAGHQLFGWRFRTPAPPPYSSMKSTPAAIISSVARRTS